MSKSRKRSAPTITRRSAQPDDDAFLFELYARTRHDEMAAWGLAQALPDPLLRIQFAGRQGTYRTQFPHADHHILLQHERRIGRLLVDRTGPALVLVDLALVPEVQGRGIGTELLKSLQDEAATTARPLRLSVVLTNPARRLYARLGFVGLGDDGVYEQMEWRPPSVIKRSDSGKG